MKGVDWNIIAKYLANENLSESEKQYIYQIKKNKELNKYLEESANAWEKTRLIYQLNQFDTNNAWKKQQTQLTLLPKRITTYKKLLHIAAIFIFVLTTVLITSKFISPKFIYCQTTQNDISHPVTTLPDGTRVTLNYNSKINYPKKFSGNKRVVKLKGEAFFDVTPNKQRPFVIETNCASIKVLGTSFNIRAYQENPVIEVIVRTGQIELTDNTKNKILILPNEKGTFDKNTDKLQKQGGYNINKMAWLTGKIEFHSSSLEEVFSTLKQAYNTKIKFSDDVDLSQIITASFNQQEPDYILHVIALTLHLNVSNAGNNSYYIDNK